MIVFCTERFKTEYTKLIKRNSYRDLEKELINGFFNRSDEQVFAGYKITGTDSRRIIKKRLGGSGGYRVYFYAYITEKKAYLGYVYPKTGSEGKQSLNADFETMLIREIKEAILSDELYELKIENEKLIFAACR